MTRRKNTRAFTLVELLVVIGVIAVLVGILLPAISRAWDSAKTTTCQSNLREIGAAIKMYANDNGDHYPDRFVVGNWYFRRRPGLRNPLDPSSYPEWMGLAAVLHGIRVTDFNLNMSNLQVEQALNEVLARKGRYLSATSGVWICPTRPAAWMEFGITYAFAIHKDMGLWTSIHRSHFTKMENVMLMMDNTKFRPYTPGAMAPTPAGNQYTISQTFFTHKLKGQKVAFNQLYMDGRVDLRTKE